MLLKEPTLPQTGQLTGRPNYFRPVILTANTAGLLYYLFSMQWTPYEFVRTLVGLAALWLPIGSVVYLLLSRKETISSLNRLVFSLIASYSLTTLFFFGFSVIQLTPLFYLGQILLTLGVVVFLVRRTQPFDLKKLVDPAKLKARVAQVDLILAGLIVLSLLAAIRYQEPYKIDPQTGDRTFVLMGDQTYFTSLAYELDRNVPPVQQPVKAGVAERAYHLFPHLTDMLIARYTGQGDFMRSHTAYHYTIIAILLCLATFCIVKTLTRSRWGGYFGVALIYLLVVPFPPLKPNDFGFFFFTIYPQLTTNLEPVIVLSPQFYSGLVVLYGVLLGVLMISSLVHRREKTTWLIIIIGLMVASLMRFRIQMFIPLFPGFLLLVMLGFWRTRQKVYMLAGLISLIAGVLLYREMQSPVYLENTVQLRIGYNYLTSPTYDWINGWPFSGRIHGWLGSLITDPEILKWVWQALSMPAFVAFNIIGLPLLAATIFFTSLKSSRREWLFYTGLSIWLVVMSTIGAMLISVNYDNYSVGGQMLLVGGWYLFPLMGTALWYVYLFLKKRYNWSRLFWGISASLAILACLASQQVMRPTIFDLIVRNDSLKIEANDWLALNYLHDSTPKEAVIISNKHLDPLYSIYGGLAGRAAYYEYTINILDDYPSGQTAPENRKDRIGALWSATDSGQFCQLLQPTGATYLVEYANQPLKVSNAPCLKQTWVSPVTPEKVTIWQIIR